MDFSLNERPERRDRIGLFQQLDQAGETLQQLRAELTHSSAGMKGLTAQGKTTVLRDQFRQRAQVEPEHQAQTGGCLAGHRHRRVGGDIQ
ncbi:hypothetical protein D3C80_1011830 [compost metagenome]